MTRNDELSLSELRDAEKVPGHGGDNSYLVRVDEGDYRSVPNTGFTTLALHDDDLFDAGSISIGSMNVEVDFDDDTFVMERDGDSLRVPDEVRESFLYAVHDRDEARLNDIFDEHYTPTVRRGVVGQFMPRFRQDDELEQTDDGWLTDDGVLVRWDGSNEVADSSVDPQNPCGNSVDVGRTALHMSFDFDAPAEATTPAGRTYELDEAEMKFLTTVGLAVERNPDIYGDALYRSIEAASVDAFTDTKSGIHHGHNRQKHRLDDSELAVTDEAIDRLWTNEYDHAGVWEMKFREQEFKNAPFDVFENVPNDDESRWESISYTADRAHIPQDFKNQLREMYE